MTQKPSPTSEHSVTPEEKEFLYCVGRAITEWAQVDERLFQICAAVLRASKEHVAIIYYRTNTLGARLVLVDELVTTVLPKSDRKNGGHNPPVTADWMSLKKDIEDALSVRNQLAHSPSGPQAELERRPDGTAGITDIWWASYKSATEKLRAKGRGNIGDLKIDDVTAHVQAVGHIWIRLRNFETTSLPTLLSERP